MQAHGRSPSPFLLVLPGHSPQDVPPGGIEARTRASKPVPPVMGPPMSHLLAGLCVWVALGQVEGSAPYLGPAEQEQNHYLAQLFGLYGENGTLTAGGLARLLHSLGLGRVQALRLGSVLVRYVRRRQWHPTPVLLPGKSHGWISLIGYSPWCRRV